MIKMPKTIRTKLFLSFTIAILVLQVFFWAVSSFGMEKMLIFGRERNMRGLLMRYEAYMREFGEEDGFVKLSAASDGNLTYLDTETGTYYSTMPAMRNDRMMANRGRSALQAISKSLGLPTGSVRTFILGDVNGENAQATVIGKLSDHQFLVSERQMSVIKESTRLFSSYLALAGICIITAGAFISHWLARRITRPIIEIEKQAVLISNLEFNSHNNIQSEDEIGSLAVAVNQISYSLEEKINQLFDANLKLKGEIEQERLLEQSRRSFVANVSHELKTPISMIMGYADGLKHGVAQTTSQKEHYYDVIVKESEHMTKLINQLLDLSAYQAGKQTYIMKPLALETLIESAAERHQLLFAESGLGLSVKASGNWQVFGDLSRLEMVLSNMLTNACKYADPATEVTLTVNGDDKNVFISLSNWAADFSMEDLEQLTVSFYRGKNARDRQVDGFGIGLGTIKEVVESHHGNLALSYADQIFMVRVTLPIITIEGLESSEVLG